MSERRYRVLVVSSHVVQYATPVFRQMAQHPKLDFQVAYCSLQGAQPGFDREFGIEVAWDIPLLDGYPWVVVPSRFVKPRLGSFLGLINPGLWKLIWQGNFDAVFVFGHQYLSCWIAILATKFCRSALIMSYDANTLASQDGQRWKVPLKKLLLPGIFRLAEVTCAASSGTANLLQSFGVPREHIVLSPGTGDSERLRKACQVLSRQELRKNWRVPPEAPSVLFCGKLQPWKRPQDLLRAFAQACVPQAYLLFAGDGPLRAELEAEAHDLGIADRVRFLGFLNQSRVPGAYVASDLLVLPSEHEPFGLVVSEAMVCGLPAVVSDQVGARFELIDGRETGFVYRAGEVDALAKILHELLPDRERLRRMGEAARNRMQTWSPKEKIESIVTAVRKAVDLMEERAGA